MYTLPLYVGIILQNANTVFLVQRNNTNWMSGYWNFPGGLVEKNESLVQAAVREIEEEAGVIVDSKDCKLIHVLHVKKSTTNTQDIVGCYFVATAWQGTPRNNEPDKARDAQWFSLEALPDDITDHALCAIQALKDGTPYSESGWY